MKTVNGVGPYSAPGRKSGEECVGFTKEGNKATGATACHYCYGRDVFAGVPGAGCTGTVATGQTVEGKVVCGK